MVMNRMEMCFIAFLRTTKLSQSGHPLAVYTSCLCSDKPRWCQVCIVNKYLPADWQLFVRMPLSSRVAKQLSARSSAFPRLIASAPSLHIQIQHQSRWARTRVSSQKIITFRSTLAPVLLKLRNQFKIELIWVQIGNRCNRFSTFIKFIASIT